MAQSKHTLKHTQPKALPPERRRDQLHSGRKHFIDNIKFIAFRAETAMLQDIVPAVFPILAAAESA